MSALVGSREHRDNQALIPQKAPKMLRERVPLQPLTAIKRRTRWNNQ